MLYYDRINLFEGTDVHKTSHSKQCNICHYRYFLKKRFKFQPYESSRCHGLLIMSINLSDIAILKIKDADYLCIVTGISKIEAINLMKNIDLTEKSRTLWNIKIYYHI